MICRRQWRNQKKRIKKVNKKYNKKSKSLAIKEITQLLCSNLPYYEREDKDDFLYIATLSDVKSMAKIIYDYIDLIKKELI